MSAEIVYMYVKNPLVVDPNLLDGVKQLVDEITATVLLRL